MCWNHRQAMGSVLDQNSQTLTIGYQIVVRSIDIDAIGVFA